MNQLSGMPAIAPPTVVIANPSADVYGSDLQMLESVTALRDAGYRVVVAIPAGGPLVALLTERGAEVEFVDFPVLRRANQSATAFASMVGGAAAAVPRLVRYLKRTAPHALYVNTVTLPWWLLAGRLAGVRTIAHLHEAENTDSQLVQRALISPLRLAHAVIVISQSAMAAMTDADPGLVRKANLIYNGVPQPDVAPVSATRAATTKLVVVGRLSPRKAPHLALEATALLRQRGHDVEIELAGSPFEGYEWYETELRQRAEQPDLAGAVNFAGYCKPIWPNLRDADIMVAPSLREPFGNAVVEAQLALRPVVATAALGHLESIIDKQTGLLVPSEDVEAMASAIESLINDPEWSSALADSARDRAIQLFSTDRYSQEVVRVVDGRRGQAKREAAASGRPVVRILGTHGVPAGYGGFETAAENVARFLVDKGWRVVVYCQGSGTGPVVEDVWEGIERVTIPVPRDGWLGTSQFDLLSIKHAAAFDDINLTFGYNTAVFNVVQRIKRIPNVINMDGIEWSRARWGKFRQAILYTNERIACFVGNELIADHPELNTYLRTRAPARKITTITYGGPTVESAPTDVLEEFGLTPGGYATLIARPIPENTILEIIQGFTARRRDIDLVVLGNYKPEEDPYHAAVVAAGNDQVHFVGGIYEPERVQALRFHSVGYVHGHTVGGTNPSLVEALGAGNPVIAHDNAYNRWVAGDAGLYFETAADFDSRLTELLGTEGLRARLSAAARARHAEEFTWDHVAGQYEQLLLKAARRRQRTSTRTGR